jgi:hypothetical protein
MLVEQFRYFARFYWNWKYTKFNYYISSLLFVIFIMKYFNKNIATIIMRINSSDIPFKLTT